MYFRNRGSTVRFVSSWLSAVNARPDYWEQTTFNDLARAGWDPIKKVRGWLLTHCFYRHSPLRFSSAVLFAYTPNVWADHVPICFAVQYYCHCCFLSTSIQASLPTYTPCIPLLFHPQLHPDNPRVFLGFNDTLYVGVLPVSQFSGGHTYFIQRLHEVCMYRYGELLLAVHG